MSSRFILPFADVGGGIKPSDGAQLFFFETGTSTPKDTFSDQLSTPTPNSNPVVSDSNGVFSDIFIEGAYKVVLKDKNNVQTWEADPVESLLTEAEIDALVALAAITVDDIDKATEAGALGVEGDFIRTNEYSSGSGTGAGLYRLVSADPGSPFTNPQRDDGLWLKLVELLNLNTFQSGVTGDGVADDTIPYTEYLNNKENIEEQRVSTAVSIETADKYIKDQKVIADSIAGITLTYISPVVANTTTSSKAFTFVNSVNMTSVTGIVKGTVVKIKSATVWPFWVDAFYGHIAKVESVSGSTVTFEQPFLFSIESGAEVTVYEGGTLILDRASIENAVSSAGTNSKCLSVTGYGHVEIDNPVLENGQSLGLFVAYCVAVNITGGEYRFSNATSTGYGIQLWGCNEVNISGIVGHGNRRLVDFSGDIPTLASSIRNFKVHGGGLQEDGSAYSPLGGVENFGVGSHGGAVAMDISDGYISNCSTGINIRSVKTKINNVHFDGAIVNSLFALTDGADIEVSNCTYRPFGNGYDQDTINPLQTLLPEQAFLMSLAFCANGGKLKVTDCDFHLKDSFIRASGQATGRVEIKDNNCKFDADGGGTSSWLRGDFDNVSIDGRTVESVSGTRVLLGSSSTSLPPGTLNQEENYKATIADNEVSAIELNTSSSQAGVTVFSRSNADIRGHIMSRQGSATLRDFGSSNLISSASGVLANGDGVGSNITISLQDGVLYLANQTGAEVDLTVTVQGSE